MASEGTFVQIEQLLLHVFPADLEGERPLFMGARFLKAPPLVEQFRQHHQPPALPYLPNQGWFIKRPRHEYHLLKMPGALVKGPTFAYTQGDLPLVAFSSFIILTMGLPAKRRTKQSKRERSTHFALKTKRLVTCSHCKRRILPHRVCPHCGYYQGREVVKMAVRTKTSAKKKEAAK